jgi:REP-associated tyrosine transposase
VVPGRARPQKGLAAAKTTALARRRIPDKCVFRLVPLAPREHGAYYSPFKMGLLASRRPAPGQLGLFADKPTAPAATWGGKRPGAGRKPSHVRPAVPHRSRPNHLARHPAHVTLRAGIGLLRRSRVFAQIRRALAASSRDTFRLLHFSVQTNHVHLIVEANDKLALSSGVRGIAIRVARSVNHTVARTGRLWTDRYDARALRTPREVRNALVYVLLNRRKHWPASRGLDPCSSAAWFDGWKVPIRHRREGRCRRAGCDPPAPVPVAAARTWLARVGWRRHGLLRGNDRPKLA